MTTTSESVVVNKRKFLDRVGCRAFLNADQANISSTTWVKVALNDNTYDLGLNFASNKFTVPVTGLYQIIGQVSFTNSVQVDKRYSVAIYKEGALITQKDAQASVADTLSVNINDILYLKKDEYVELYTYTTGIGDTVDIDGDTGGSLTFLVVRLISKEGIKQ